MPSRGLVKGVVSGKRLGEGALVLRLLIAWVVRLPGKGNWREAGPPNHHDDKVDSDQEVVNKELSLLGSGAAKGLCSSAVS